MDEGLTNAAMSRNLGNQEVLNLSCSRPKFLSHDFRSVPKVR